MNTLSNQKEFTTFSPGLLGEDVLANYWLQQVTIRLRREICWRWRQCGWGDGDKLIASLDMSRYWEAKCDFYQTDATGKYLTDKLEVDLPHTHHLPTRGSFDWVVQTLNLDNTAAFVLALGLAVAFDNAVGEVIAACLNDANATQPTLALAQQLWDNPEKVQMIADPAHPLWRYGLLQPSNHARAVIDWHSPITTPLLIANRLLFPHEPLPQILVPVFSGNSTAEQKQTSGQTSNSLFPESARIVVNRLNGKSNNALRIVPVRGESGSSYTHIIQRIAQLTQRQILRLQGIPALCDSDYLRSITTLCWLNNVDLFISDDFACNHTCDKSHPYAYLLSLQTIPVTVFLGIRERKDIADIPLSLLLPIIDVPKLSYSNRVNSWQQALGTANETLDKAIAECSRRFRYEEKTIQTIASGLQASTEELTESDMIAACRAELDLDIGELAQLVTPRFTEKELVLPAKQQLLFDEIYQAMKSLTKVHYAWGTAKAWNECGITVLFAGAPGTGKTMAAEVLAIKLDLPMYRIDLSQVVNKYIGETEKNLKRLFDLADISDTILFFDEADALFGRRTEVKDAHDRYANLEISYLLERMERFKGLAILATNRKKDLDEAFLRRLRYIVDFPLPDVAERKKIWQRVVPEQVDASQLDFDFLASQFQLAGGHIRSIIFNACLQIPNDSLNPKLTMERVIVAVKREFNKLNRSVSLEQFGFYAPIIEGIENEKSEDKY